MKVGVRMIQTIMDITDFIGNMCVVAITIYTFYLGYFCKRIKVVSYGSTDSVFEGSQIYFILHSYSLQTFEVKEISLVCDGKCVHLKLQEPTIIEPRRTTKILAEQYTGFTENIEMTDILFEQIHALFLHTHEGILYASLKSWDNGIIKKHLYRKQKYAQINTYSLIYGGKVISDLVKFVIYIDMPMYDEPVFMTKFGAMSQLVGGYNHIEDIQNFSMKKIRKIIADLLNISKNCVSVNEIPTVDNDKPMNIQLLDENGEDLLRGGSVGDVKIGM